MVELTVMTIRAIAAARALIPSARRQVSSKLPAAVSCVELRMCSQKYTEAVSSSAP